MKTTNLLSPFLNSNSNNTIKTGGNTTPLTAGSAGTGGQILGIPSGSGVSTPVPSGFSVAGTPGTSGGYVGYVNPSTVSSVAPSSGGTSTGGLTAAQRTADQSQLTADQSQLASLEAQAQAQAQGTTQGTIPPPTGVNSPTSSATYPGIVGTLASTAATSSPQYQAAQQQYDTANQGLATLRSNYQDQQGVIANTPEGLSEQGGAQGALTNQESGKEAALTGEMTAAQAAAQAATAQQGTQQSGLSSAGALAAPQPGQNPLTQSFNPLTNSYSPLAISGAGPNAGTELENYGSLQQQQVIGATAAQNNSYLGGAQVAASNLQNLITSNDLNPFSLTFANGALQLAAQYTSNPAYAKLPGAINDFVTSLVPILGAGGNVTDAKTQMASQFVQMLQSGATINDVIQYFTQQAQEKITGMANGGGANISGTGNTQTNGTTGNSGNTIFPTSY